MRSRKWFPRTNNPINTYLLPFWMCVGCILRPTNTCIYKGVYTLLFACIKLLLKKISFHIWMYLTKLGWVIIHTMMAFCKQVYRLYICGFKCFYKFVSIKIFSYIPYVW